jgi:hypothetical protein
MSEDDESERAPLAAVSPPAGIITRRLKSFPPPDLVVVVGPSQRIYRHHSFILASLSVYVDTMLSSPMKEQESMHITFPDIPPETWEKIIRFLEPGAYPSLSRLPDIVEVLPFYDKYQFIDGVALCDAKIRDILAVLRGNCDMICEEVISLVVMSHELNLPLSKSKAIEFACRELKRLWSWKTENHMKALLPLVENEDSILISLVRTLRGRHSRDMSIEEMRNLTKEDTFASQCVARSKEIRWQEKILQTLVVEDMMVLCRGPSIDNLAQGHYELQHDERNPGAMKNIYRKKRGYDDAGGGHCLGVYGSIRHSMGNRRNGRQRHR